LGVKGDTIAAKPPNGFGAPAAATTAKPPNGFGAPAAAQKPIIGARPATSGFRPPVPGASGFVAPPPAAAARGIVAPTPAAPVPSAFRPVSPTAKVPSAFRPPPSTAAKVPNGFSPPPQEVAPPPPANGSYLDRISQKVTLSDKPPPVANAGFGGASYLESLKEVPNNNGGGSSLPSIEQLEEQRKLILGDR
jgi:hypothetical protein